jgi:hypothetical protein
MQQRGVRRLCYGLFVASLLSLAVLARADDKFYVGASVADVSASGYSRLGIDPRDLEQASEGNGFKIAGGLRPFQPLSSDRERHEQAVVRRFHVRLSLGPSWSACSRCGCIGYIGFDGDMDLNIATRTLVQRGDYAYTWVGGGSRRRRRRRRFACPW